MIPRHKVFLCNAQQVRQNAPPAINTYKTSNLRHIKNHKTLSTYDFLLVQQEKSIFYLPVGAFLFSNSTAIASKASGLPNMPPEPITIRTFAARMGISRSTAHNWIAQERFVPGVHLLRIGRVVRVMWSSQLLEHLLSKSKKLSFQNAPAPLRRCGKGGPNHIALNLEYVENIPQNVVQSSPDGNHRGGGENGKRSKQCLQTIVQ
ncbi:helix-turn-helix transcriptional regulator [Geomonas subterranea]|uniref:helix-turn-helix transcriptional regulator n=1 Tax=Geomonas subterranea TaxID=2847989 RepID=UPI001CD734F0|nr:hypothetical protein [Geomonas fuzhouensis]